MWKSENADTENPYDITWHLKSNGFGASGGGHESSSAIGWDPTNSHRAAYAHADVGTYITKNNEDTFESIGSVRHNNRQATTAVTMRGEIIVESVGQSNDSNFLQVVAISRDSGTNWTKITNATSLFFKLIQFHPQNNNIVYADKYKFTNIQTNNDYVPIADGRSVSAVFKGNGEKIYSHSNTTIYKSTNGGDSWTTPYPSIPTGAKVSQIAVSPTDENRIYIAAPGRGIYIIDNTTSNGGTIVLKDNNHGFTLDQFGELNIKTVATDPNNANVVYAGTRASWKGIANGVFRSVDSGNTWTNITQNTFGTHLGVRSILVRPDNSYVYISTMVGTRKYPPPSTADR